MNTYAVLLDLVKRVEELERKAAVVVDDVAVDDGVLAALHEAGVPAKKRAPKGK